MIILLEGCERVGKSTLAARLSQDLGWPIVKFGIPEGDVFGYFFTRPDDALADHPNLILDRYHLSNYAYQNTPGGEVLGDGTLWGEGMRAMEGYLIQENAFLIWLVDDIDSIENRLRLTEHRDDPAATLTREQLVRIQDRFGRAYEESGITRKLTCSLRNLIAEDDEPTELYRCLVNSLAEASLSDIREGVAHGRP